MSKKFNTEHFTHPENCSTSLGHSNNLHGDNKLERRLHLIRSSWPPTAASVKSQLNFKLQGLEFVDLQSAINKLHGDNKLERRPLLLKSS
jgi:hypothetical protein